MADRRGLVIGARIVTGTVAAGVVAVVVAAVAFLPLPTLASDPRTVTVDPAPADQVRVCPGAVMRLGDVSGANADAVFAIGSPVIVGGSVDGELERSRLTSADGDASSLSAPETLRVPPADGALVAGAQLQNVDAPDFRGLAVAACGEPTGSAWLVGGASTVGRSTVLLLSNPTQVASRVSLEIFGENGPVSAPGMSGIDVPAGGQRVLSLAGFAPGLSSPVVHVTARGGRVVAALQQSIVRGLDAVGVETIGPGSEPSPTLVVPGVRIVDAVGVSRAGALIDWQDVVPVVRLGVPGAEDAAVTVRVVPVGADGVGTSFVIDAHAGEVVDIPLDAAVQQDREAPGLADGLYTVYVESDVPVVAAVRASTAVDPGDEGFAPDAGQVAPPSDLTWFAAAPPLDGAALLTVPDGPSPLVSIANPTADDAEIELASLDGGAPLLVTVPASGAVTLGVTAGTYRISGSDSLAIGVSFADAGLLASFVLAPDRPVAGPVVVRPD